MDRDVGSYHSDSDMVSEQVHVSSSQHASCDLANAVKVLTRLDLDLTYSADKLSNLHVLLMHLLARDIDLNLTSEGDDKYFSMGFIGQSLEFEYLSVYLDSEVREVAHFLDNLPAEIVDAHSKISSCRDVTEVYVIMEEKLHNCEQSLKHSVDQISEVKLHLAKLLGDLEAVQYENGKYLLISVLITGLFYLMRFCLGNMFLPSKDANVGIDS